MPEQMAHTKLLSDAERIFLLRQRGMTAFEILLMIVIMALCIVLLLTSPKFLAQSKLLAGSAQHEFVDWYQQVQANALYTTVPERVCLIGQTMVVQHYESDVGWRDSLVTYVPPRGVSMFWRNEDCSPVLNSDSADGDSFVSQISFGQPYPLIP